MPGVQLSKSVRLEYRDDIAVVIIDNPPVNALSSHVFSGMYLGVTQALESEATAIVVICEGRTFIAGADLTELGGPGFDPSMPGKVEQAIEGSTKPVIAAIHGTALGGGLEHALLMHYRVAVPSAKLGLPEVKLGLLPGGGGTQRLPRVVGVEKALEMMTSGEPIGAAEAAAVGLVDEVVEEGRLEAGAVAFARRVVAEGRPLVRVRDRRDLLDAPGVGDALFAKVRASIARKTRGFLAPEAIIRCVEAAVAGPDFEAGHRRERELFNEVLTGEQSAAQRYAFFAERAANKIPGIGRDVPLIDIARCGVLGAGTMGGGIAMNFVNVGIPVTIVERDQAALDRGLATIRKNYERSTRSGLTAADIDARMALITPSLDRQDFADCDLVIEAVFEDLELKQSVFRELDAIGKPGAILASNTSALDINKIAAVTSRPGSVIGLHFFSPANVMKMLEVVRGDATEPAVIATSMAVAKQIGKVPVLVGVCHGFVGNRMLFQRGVEANRMILEGATPHQVDRVLFDFGFAMGPFAMSDLAGLDVGWNPATSSGATLRDVICETGRRGQKNGRGYYLYDPETRAATPDPEVEQLIRDFAVRQGIEQREVTDQEVLERLLYPMVNEGAKILEEGIALRGSDIDVVWVNGYGWPQYRGGPMYWADTVGLPAIVTAVEGYHARLGGRHWELSPLLARLAAEGGQLHET